MAFGSSFLKVQSAVNADHVSTEAGSHDWHLTSLYATGSAGKQSLGGHTHSNNEVEEIDPLVEFEKKHGRKFKIKDLSTLESQLAELEDIDSYDKNWPLELKIAWMERRFGVG